jgi:hypothetical protein
MSDEEDERRRHPRNVSNTTAIVRTGDKEVKYVVRNLSVGGTLLSDGPPLPEGLAVEVEIHVPDYPTIEVKARVVHHVNTLDGAKCNGLAFLHASQITHDHIRAALLSELERSRAMG